MRRKEREITQRDEIDAIINGALVCRLALADEGRPYIVPLCFGYGENTLYFHTAGEGRKLDILRKNNRVCFEMELDCRIKPGPEACRWGMAYKSVIGFGRAFVVDDEAEKRRALDKILQHYAGGSVPREPNYPQASLAAVTILRVDIEAISGKGAA